MSEKSYTEQELIDAIWTMRSLFRVVAVELASIKGVDPMTYVDVLTPDDRVRNTQVMDLMFRVSNPLTTWDGEA